MIIWLQLFLSFMACLSAEAFIPTGPTYPAFLPVSYRVSYHHAIVDEVSERMKAAMKEKDTTTLATIRLIRAAFANAAIDLKVDALSDDQAVDVLRKMAKMRVESIDMYKKGGADDRAASEQKELDILSQWLPSLANEEQTRIWVQEAIQEAGDKVNVGTVMKSLMAAHKGEVEGSLAQKVVKEEIAKL